MNILVDMSTNLSSCISFSIFYKKQAVACLFIIIQTTILRTTIYHILANPYPTLLTDFTQNNHLDDYLVNNNRPLYSSYFIIFEINPCQFFPYPFQRPLSVFL